MIFRTSTGRLSQKPTLTLKSNNDETATQIKSMKDKQDLSTDTPWIELYMKEKNINYYEYNEFNNIEEIDNGLMGKVYRANWNQSERCITLKSFNLDNNTVKEIVYEVCN